MKKTIISTLCLAALAVTACDKKNDALENNSSTAAQATDIQPDAKQQFSKSNTADIALDMNAIQTLQTQIEPETQALGQKLQESIASGDKPAMNANTIELKNKRIQINNELEKLALKSAEGNAFRMKAIELNKLAIQLGDEGMSSNPDAEKMKALMQSATDLQSDIQTHMEMIQSKISS